MYGHTSDIIVFVVWWSGVGYIYQDLEIISYPDLYSVVQWLHPTEPFLGTQRVLRKGGWQEYRVYAEGIWRAYSTITQKRRQNEFCGRKTCTTAALGREGCVDWQAIFTGFTGRPSLSEVMTTHWGVKREWEGFTAVFVLLYISTLLHDVSSRT